MHTRHLSFLLPHAGLEIDEALREYLELVWLHGESQKIQRILSSFAAHFFTQNPSVFMNQDAATTMSFAVIMLNTNLHHPKVDPVHRSSFCVSLVQSASQPEGPCEFPTENFSHPIFIPEVLPGACSMMMVEMKNHMHAG